MNKNKYKEGAVTFYPLGIMVSILIAGIVSFCGRQEFIKTGNFPIKTTLGFGLFVLIALIFAAVVTYIWNKEENNDNE